MKVFFVILNWNRAEDTIECLKSIEAIKTQKHEVGSVVVDNGSTDNSVDQIINYVQGKDAVEIIQVDENLGFAAGNNVGLERVLDKKADFVVVLNNDTLVESHLVDSMLECFKDDKVGAVSPKIYFAKGYEFHKNKYTKSQLGKVIWCAGGKLDWANIFGINVGVDEVDEGQYDYARQIDFATGACVIYRAKALKKVGLYDSRYFMYMEDVEHSYRLRRNGYQIWYCPGSIIWHKVAQSSRIGGSLNDYFISRNRLLFGIRYASVRTKFALFRESLRLLGKGRKWQRIGVRDYYMGKFGKGSWE